MEYTDQEIEMLARFYAESSGVSWDALSDIRRKGLIASVCDALAERWWGCESVTIRAAARLMREAREQGLATAHDEIRKAGEREQATWDQLVRDVKEAREQGAAEMRERAAELVRSGCHDHPSTREILANIRALSLTVPQ